MRFRKISIQFFFQTALSLGLIMIIACENQNKITVRHAKIPPDVNFVMTINLNTINQKASQWRRIWSSEFWEKMELMSKEEKEIQAIYEQVLHTGLDHQYKAYFFAKFAQDIKKTYYGFSFLLKDPKKFEQALQDLKEKPEIKQIDDLKYIVSKTGGVLGWKDVTALFVGTDEAGGEEKMLAKFKQILSTPSNESLEKKNQEFAKLDAQIFDLGFWSHQKNINSLYPNPENIQNISPVFSELFKISNYTSGGITFEKGQMLLETTAHLNPKLSQKYETLLQEGVEPILLENIPINSPHTFFGIGLKMNVLFEIMKEDPNFKESDKALAELDLSYKELTDMLGGNVLLAIRDYNMPSYFNNPKPSFVLVADIQNLTTLKKVLQKALILKFINKESEQVYTIPKIFPSPIFLILKENKLFITMITDYKNSILKNENSLDTKFKEMLKGNSLLFWVDVQTLYQQISPLWLGESEELDSFRSIILPELREMIVHITPIKNHQATGKIIMRWMNEKENSLAIITKIIQKFNQKSQKRISQNYHSSQ